MYSLQQNHRHKLCEPTYRFHGIARVLSNPPRHYGRVQWVFSHAFTPGLVTESTPPGVMVGTILVPLAIFMLIFSIYTTKKGQEDSTTHLPLQAQGASRQ